MALKQTGSVPSGPSDLIPLGFADGRYQAKSAGEAVYGAFPNAVPSYKAKALNPSVPIKFAVLSDSTSDGYADVYQGASTSWDHVWPQLLMAKLRAQQALPTGGDGWIPASVPTGWQGGYRYSPTILRPTGFALDMLNTQIGIPGALWLQSGHASNVWDVEYQLSPGVTAVDVVTTRYGQGTVNIVCANSAATTTVSGDATREFKRITNPGASIRLAANNGVGFALLGVFEYVGDEAKGFRMMNFAYAGITAAEIHSWLGNSTYSMKPMIAAHQPDVVFICAGSNDLSNAGKTPAEAMQSLGGIALEVLNAAPNATPVFIMRPNPSTEFATLTQLVKDNAAQVNAQVLDLRNDPRIALSNTSLYIADGVHFSSAGDEAMADLMADYMKVQTSSTVTPASVQAQIDAALTAKIQVVTALPAVGTPGVLYLKTE